MNALPGLNLIPPARPNCSWSENRGYRAGEPPSAEPAEQGDGQTLGMPPQQLFRATFPVCLVRRDGDVVKLVGILG